MTLAAFLEAKGRTPQARRILKAAIALQDGEEAARKILFDERSRSLRMAFDALPEWVRENHDNTAFYAVLVGQRMGFDAARLRNLYVASFLHDTGKVRIPENILNKPGPLTSDEKKVMAEHVGHSLDLIGAVPASVFEEAGVSREEVLKTIAAYHEEPDGSGYPKGLKGPEFTTDSAILHAADSVDAMMSPRPYQAEPQPLQAVLNQLRGSIGDPQRAKFEPQVARIFLEILSPRDRTAGLSGRGARLSKLKEFYQRRADRQRTAGSVALFVPASIDAVMQSLGELEKRFGTLSGRTLLDFGAGDLRVSLAAAALFGMKVTAVEKDPRIHEYAAGALQQAVAEGLIDRNSITLLGPRDALDVPWTHDVIFFYYVQPEGEEGEAFRKRLEEKILRETGPDSYFVMLLTKSQWEDFNRQEFETLKPANSVPESIFYDLGKKDAGLLYLMLYQGRSSKTPTAAEIEALDRARSAPKDPEGARLAQNIIVKAEAAQNADPETLVLIARALLDLKKISKTLPFEFKLGNALITAELDERLDAGWVYFDNVDQDGRPIGKPFAQVRLTEAIVNEARKLKDRESALRVKLIERSEALEVFADDQKSAGAARQFYNQLKKSKAPDVEFDNNRTVVLRFATEKKLRPEKIDLYHKQLQTLHSIAGKKVLLQFAQIGGDGTPVLYGPSDPNPAKGEDLALFHLSELSENALKAAQGEEAGFVSVKGLADDETVIPFVAQGVFLAALGRLSGYTDSIQQLWRNVRGGDALIDLDPEAFRDIRKVRKIDLQRYSDLQLRTIARIAWEKVLEYTRLALQAVGSAA
jgi:hypothetical protein